MLAIYNRSLTRNAGFVTKNCLKSLSSNNSTETYTERQAKKGRHVSPHVAIYKFPVAALSSISNRVTGVILSAGFTGIGAIALVNGDVPSLMSTVGSIPVIGTVAKMGVTFSLVYHYLGGVRHVIWDKAPQTLTNEQVEKSSYALFAGAAAATVVFGLLV